MLRAARLLRSKGLLGGSSPGRAKGLSGRASDRFGQADTFTASVKLQAHAASAVFEHRAWRGQALSALALSSTLAGPSRWRRIIKPRIQMQATGKVAIGGQLAQHALAAVETVGDEVKTERFFAVRQHAQHLERQFGAGAIDTPRLLGRARSPGTCSPTASRLRPARTPQAPACTCWSSGRRRSRRAARP